MPENNHEYIQQIIQDGEEVISSINDIIDEIDDSIRLLLDCIKKDGKIILFGNGGSAADAQHIAAEFVGRFKIERISMPAIALTTDSSILTSVGNDYSFELIFSRQCESLVQEGDVVIALSTSGNSINVLNGVKMAKKKKAKIIGLLGNSGGKISELSDVSIIVNSNSTPRIQEGHRLIAHIICEIVEKQFVNNL
jgi:D-sedoheptulose 7-phosphate isomerase